MKKVLPAMLLLIFCLSLAANASQLSVVDRTQRYNTTIIVKDKENKPVQGVVVTPFEGTNQPSDQGFSSIKILGQGITDVNGRSRFYIPAGTYHGHLGSRGIVSQLLGPFTRRAGGVVNWGITVTTLHEYTPELFANGTLSVRLKVVAYDTIADFIAKRGGRSVSGALVTAYAADVMVVGSNWYGVQGITDGDGILRASFPCDREGRAQLNGDAIKRGYWPPVPDFGYVRQSDADRGPLEIAIIKI